MDHNNSVQDVQIRPYYTWVTL